MCNNNIANKFVQKHLRILDLCRYAVWKDAPGPGKQQAYIPGQYPSLDDLAQGPYGPLRKTAVRYYGQKLPRHDGVTKKAVKAQPTSWRNPTRGILQQIPLAPEVHHILPVVVLWNLAKSMLHTIVLQPDAPDTPYTQAIVLTNKVIFVPLTVVRCFHVGPAGSGAVLHPQQPAQPTRRFYAGLWAMHS